MKRYAPGDKVPMKFHNLYVWILNPIKLIFLAIGTAVALLLLLGSDVIPAETYAKIDIPYVSGGTALWVLFIALLLAFLFALMAETLLARRRVMGVTLLILGYAMDLISAVTNMITSATPTTVAVVVIQAIVTWLVCVYYWRRGPILH